MSEPTIITRTRTNVYAKGMKIELCESTVEKKFVLMNDGSVMAQATDGSLSPAVEADNILAGWRVRSYAKDPVKVAQIDVTDLVTEGMMQEFANGLADGGVFTLGLAYNYDGKQPSLPSIDETTGEGYSPAAILRVGRPGIFLMACGVNIQEFGDIENEEGLLVTNINLKVSGTILFGRRGGGGDLLGKNKGLNVRNFALPDGSGSEIA